MESCVTAVFLAVKIKPGFSDKTCVEFFNSRGGCVYVAHSCCYQAKRPNLKLEIWPKQLLGFLPLDRQTGDSNLVRTPLSLHLVI